jgi:hypothetical protein
MKTMNPKIRGATVLFNNQENFLLNGWFTKMGMSKQHPRLTKCITPKTSLQGRMGFSALHLSPNGAPNTRRA